MSRVYAKMFSLQCKEHKTSLLPALAQAAGEAVLLPAVSEAVGETAQGRRRRLCFSSCALYGSTAKESAQPSPRLPHPLIHKWKRWVPRAKTKYGDGNARRAVFTPIPTVTDVNHQITALWLQQQSPNTAAYSLSKHTEILAHARVLQSIQSISAVISIISSKLFLELVENRPSLCPNTAEADLYIREHLLWLQEQGLQGQISFLSFTQQDRLRHYQIKELVQGHSGRL